MSRAAGPRDSLAIELAAPAEVSAGEPVRFTILVGNRGATPLDLCLRGRSITVDVEVRRADGALAWRRLAGEIIPAILHLRTLAPGVRIEVGAVWDQRTDRSTAVGPGEYVARGLLLVEGDPRPTPDVAFRIVAA